MKTSQCQNCEKVTNSNVAYCHECESKLTKNCPACAEKIKLVAIKCKHCGEMLDRKGIPNSQFNPGIAAVLSLVIPGAGHMYKGQVLTGITWLIIVIIGYLLLVLPGLILHLLCILDSKSTKTYSIKRKKINGSRKSNSFIQLLFAVPIGIVIPIFLMVWLNKDEAYPQSPQKNRYNWQSSCAISCEKALGVKRLDMINEQSCETLPAMSEIQRTDNQQFWDSAINDKIVSLGC